MASIYDHPYLYQLMYSDYRSDIPFILWLAKNYSRNKPILELACGTLRITRELAKEGYEVVGVDISQKMISYGIEQLYKESSEVRRRISIRLGDMRTAQITHHSKDPFSSPQKGAYHLAIVPFTAFQHLLTRNDQLQALANIRDHLDSKAGFFLADIFNPNPDKLNHELTFDKEVWDLQSKERLFRWQSSHYDEASKTARWVFLSEVFGANGGSKLRCMYEEKISIIFPDQWHTLLIEAGFKIKNKWGCFDRSSFNISSSKRMLFLCKKA